MASLITEEITLVTELASLVTEEVTFVTKEGIAWLMWSFPNLIRVKMSILEHDFLYIALIN